MKPESLWESDSKSKIKAFLGTKGYSVRFTSVPLVIFDTSWKLDRNHISFRRYKSCLPSQTFDLGDNPLLFLFILFTVR